MAEEEVLQVAALKLAREHGWKGLDKEKKLMTNAYLFSRDPSTGVRSLLLGLKKRGFGANLINGFGGKVEAGESIASAAQREMLEEAGVKLVDAKLSGVLLYDYPLKEKSLLVFVYRAEKHEGEPCETEEMRPQWVAEEDIDFSKMWADDEHWFAHLLDGSKQFVGCFDFSEDMTKVVSFSVQTVERA